MEQAYHEKMITVEQAVNLIRSGDIIVTAEAAGQPVEFMKNLANRVGEIRDVKILPGLPFAYIPEAYDTANIDSLNYVCGFYSRAVQKMHQAGMAQFLPLHLSEATEVEALQAGNIDYYVFAASPPDEHGYLSCGLTAMTFPVFRKKAKVLIAEVNKNMPRTFGDTVIHISQLDYFYESEQPIPTLPKVEITDNDKKIGVNIAKLIDDGSTVQLGIGAIPSAAALELGGKKNLGIHTEMLTDAVLDLFEKGAITGSEKTIFNNQIITCFTFGSRRLYDFVDNNPGIMHISSTVSNDSSVISKNEKMVSINSTLQIDLFGQCASEAIGINQVSGTGGQVDTTVGARRSKGGKAIMALHSTAEIVDKKTGEKILISKIKTTHEEGTIITLGRADVDYVVTEYGIAHLRGLSVPERAKALIQIAHPVFRGLLDSQARQIGIII